MRMASVSASLPVERPATQLVEHDRDEVVGGPRGILSPRRVVGGRRPGSHHLVEGLALRDHRPDLVADVTDHAEEPSRALGRLGREPSTAAWKTQSVERAHANIVMGKDQHAPAGQRFVAPDVIRMDMGVDQKANLTVRDLPNRGDQPVGERREERIDQQDTLGVAMRLSAELPLTPHINAAGRLDHAKRFPSM